MTMLIMKTNIEISTQTTEFRWEI